MRLTWASRFSVLVVLAASSLALGALALGCGGDEDDDEDDRRDTAEVGVPVVSKIEGKLDLATLPAPPTEVVAVNEANVRVAAPPGPDGTFSLSLERGHDYKLAIVVPPGEVPIAFPRPENRLDRNFRITSGNAVVSLGTVRHFATAPEAGIVVHTDPNACVAGTLPGTTDPCALEVTLTTCAPPPAPPPPAPGAPPSDEDDDDDREDGDDDRDERPMTPAVEENADAAFPFAVPDRNAPNEVIGCED